MGASRECARLCVVSLTFRTRVMKKNLLLIAMLAVMLAGCVVVPARPVVVRAPGVVVY